MYKRSNIRTFQRNKWWQKVQVIFRGNRRKNHWRQFGIAAMMWACSLVVFSILIPGLIVKQEGVALQQWRAAGDEFGQLHDRSGSEAKPSDQQGLHIAGELPESPLTVPVFITEREHIERVPLEAYVRGVLAAEMPIQFETEAFKAQAIAARTYIVHRIVNEDYSHVPVEGAWVTDSITHQAYMPLEEVEKRLQDAELSGQWYKLTQAVAETAGQIMTYDNKPIQAAYFSTSNGKTENSEEYWSVPIPYLRSVPSPWDEHLSPKYEQTLTIPIHEVFTKLGIARETLSSGKQIEIRTLSKTEGDRVKMLDIGGRSFTGREVREKLELPSAHFQVKVAGSNLEIKTFGYGHGVGMSQYGAQGMALEGKSAENILKYYYKGVEITDLSQILSQNQGILAKKL